MTMNPLSRRHFLKTGTLGATGLLTALYTRGNMNLLRSADTGTLTRLSRELTMTWGNKLLSLQIKDKNDPHYGTLIYPNENAIHGRMGDCVYPFLHLAASTDNHAFLDAAVLLYRWMERTVSQEDGSWLNDPEKGAWKGTTVFCAIALAEAVKHHGHILDNKFKAEIQSRLKKSGDFIYNNFSINYGNINYPVTATYGLSLLGEILDEPKFRKKGQELAHQVLPFITAHNGLLSGEGGPYQTKSPKGCLSVDLGYNVEESLPSLIMYASLTKDAAVLAAAEKMLNTHLEFMLPDGGWDNSWGTRNYKWTYWGSRTSDGCQPAYALMADRNPLFYKAALANTQLLQGNTHEGLLYGGPHYLSHGITPSLHHTFCHIKALVTILDHGIPSPAPGADRIQLPREKQYGSRFFEDVQTGLISTGPFRATVTAYDRNYKDFKGGHASGGALTMLWHEDAKVIISASMNEYQLYEAHNMQKDTDPLSMPLTPRITFRENGKWYTNINDFSADMKIENKGEVVIVRTKSSLVDKEQQTPASGPVNCQTTWQFEKDKVTLQFSHNDSGARAVQIIVPVVSPSTDTHFSSSPESFIIKRNEMRIHVNGNKQLHILPMTGKRIFNYVPGLEAIPFSTTENELTVQISISY